MENKKKIEVLPNDAIMDIKISGAFVSRLQELFLYLAKLKEEKEFLLHYAVITKVKPEEFKDPYEHHLYTVLALIHEIELVAKENKKTSLIDEADIKPPTEN